MNNNLPQTREEVLNSAPYKLWKKIIKIQRQAIKAKLAGLISEQVRLENKLAIINSTAQ